jgi:pilus assembly protein Flp/PilA
MEYRRLQGDEGASLVEYALLLALIAFVCIGALSFFGTGNKGSVDNSASSIVNGN